ncbi:MAG: galactokinase family protein [Erysipelotrichaceae bacterium]|nr:galactokinase family protein [Erysipelotrichaceae bacterium]
MNIENCKTSINQGQLDEAFKKLTVTDQQILTRNRWLNLIDDFSEYFNETEIYGFSAPGRTEIGGNHTDHQQGRVLAAAVNLDTIAIVSKNVSSEIRIISKGYDVKTVNLGDLNVKTEEKHTTAALVRGVCAGFVQRGYSIGGFNAVIDSQVLSGSGISSSAAFEVLIGQILSDLFNQGNVSAQAIAKIGQYAENEYFKKPCGLMDQMASAIGGFVFIDFYDLNDPVVEPIDYNLEKAGYVLCLTDTGGSHENLSEAYGLMVKEMKDVADYFGHPVLSRVTMDIFLEHLPQIKEKFGDRSCLRAFHFLDETNRVIEQKNSLKANDLQSFLKLVIESGHSSYMYLQNVYMPTDSMNQPLALALAVSQHTLIQGAYRVHGGGLAGTIQAFVQKEQLVEYNHSMEHIFKVGCTYNLAIRSVGSLQVF